MQILALYIQTTLVFLEFIGGKINRIDYIFTNRTIEIVFITNIAALNLPM
jgi:hypothetical protein